MLKKHPQKQAKGKHESDFIRCAWFASGLGDVLPIPLSSSKVSQSLKVSGSLGPHGMCSLPGSLSMKFSKQEYRSGLPFPSPGALNNLGIELKSAAWQADSLPSEPPGKPNWSKLAPQEDLLHRISSSFSALPSLPSMPSLPSEVKFPFST